LRDAERSRLGAELKHDGYRLQIHIRNGRVRLETVDNDIDAPGVPFLFVMLAAAVRQRGRAFWFLK